MRRTLFSYICIGTLVFLSAVMCRAAELTLPTIFSDHMVLQREQPVPVWGTADAGAQITVEFAGQTKTAVADAEGHWKVVLDPMPASKVPAELKVTSSIGNQKSAIGNVLVGEVWLCSGQSNMQWAMNNTDNGDRDIPKAASDTIRLYYTPRVPSDFPLEKIDAQWTECTPDTVRGFSAVAYYFGKKLNAELDVPVGLLHSSWGGTRIEPWTPPCGFEGIDAVADIHAMVQKTLPDSPYYKKAMSRYLEQVKLWSTESAAAFEKSEFIPAPPAVPEGLMLAESHQTATKLYNGMIHAHVPFAIKGAIWYQGESNRQDGMLYVEKTKALLQGWRSLWGYDFPYYFVQIAPFQYGKEDPEVLARFWEAQSEIVKQVPNTGMAVVSDHTTLNDIHPPNKEVPGTRLALLALDNTYGKEVVSTGPVFRKMVKSGNAMKLYFDSAEGLTTRDGEAPDWFEMAGKDRVFKKAKAVIEGETVIITSAEVPEPLAMRFAWNKLAIPNLVNGAGLPTSAFRAGRLPEITVSSLPEAAGFRTVYEIDLPADANYAKMVPTYSTDKSAEAGSFKQVAYFLELKKPGQPKQFVFASMDAFSKNAAQIGIPTVKSGAKFMQKVSNLTVRSNVEGIVETTNSDGGNMEFWPGNYSPPNQQQIPGATGKFDFGDTGADKIPGYGCMQIHNWKAKQTVFAINRWGGGGVLDIGIGNSEGETADWTFTDNAQDYSLRRLTVLVK